MAFKGVVAVTVLIDKPCTRVRLHLKHVMGNRQVWA